MSPDPETHSQETGMASMVARWNPSLPLQERLPALLFGDDIFISYSRADTTTYAAALAKWLTEKGFSCYLDQWTTNPDIDLPDPLKRAIRRSGIFVLLASGGAVLSEHVTSEVKIFKPTKRPFIVVKMTDNMEQATWFDAVRGAAITVDIQRDADRPSQQVVERIANSFAYRTRNQRLKLTSWSILISTAAVLLVGAGISRYTVRNAQVTRDKTFEEMKNAQIGRDQAKRDAAHALEEKKEADIQFDAEVKAGVSLQTYPEDPVSGLTQAVSAFRTRDLPATRAALLTPLLRDPYLLTYIDSPEDSELDLRHLELSGGTAPTLLAAVDRDVFAWELHGNGRPRVIHSPSNVTAIAGWQQMVAYANSSDQEIRVLRSPSDKKPLVISGPGRIQRLVFLDGDILFGFGYNGIVRWHLRASRMDTISLSTVVEPYAVSSDGQYVAAGIADILAPGEEDGKLAIRHAALLLSQTPAGVWEKVVSLDNLTPKSLSFPDAGHAFVLCADGTAFDVELGSKQRKLVTLVSGSGEPKFIVPGSRTVIRNDFEGLTFFAADRNVSGTLIHSSRLTGEGVEHLAMSGDGRYLSAKVDNSHLAVWDLQLPNLGLVRHEELGSNALAMAMDPTKPSLAVAQESEGNGSLLEKCNGRLATVDLGTHLTSFPALVALRDDQESNCNWEVIDGDAREDNLRLFRVAGRKVQSYKLEKGVPYGVRPAVSNDGTTVAHCGKGFQLLDVRDPTHPALISHPGLEPSCKSTSPLAFDSQGRYLAVASYLLDAVSIWDLKENRKVLTLKEGYFDQIFSIAISPDLHTVAVGMAGNRIELWSINLQAPSETHRISPRSFLQLLKPNIAVISMKFSPKGDELYMLNLDVNSVPFRPDAWSGLALSKLPRSAIDMIQKSKGEVTPQATLATPQRPY